MTTESLEKKMCMLSPSLARWRCGSVLPADMGMRAGRLSGGGGRAQPRRRPGLEGVVGATIKWSGCAHAPESKRAAGASGSLALLISLHLELGAGCIFTH